MSWTITEWEYKPNLQGIEFALASDGDKVIFVMSFMAIADYFQVEQSRSVLAETFERHKQRIASFASRVIDICPVHDCGHRLLSLNFCREMAL